MPVHGPLDLRRRRLLVAGLAATAVTPWAVRPARADQPVRLVVGYAAGGPVDGAARSFAPLLSAALGETVVVDNRPGAGGVLGAEVVAKAEPDGRTLYFGASPTVTISPHVLKSMTLDPQKDLTPVAPLSNYANVLVANLGAPFKDAKELIAYAKAHPGDLTYGSAGVGASNHLSGALLAQRTGTELTHIPYKGNSPAMTDVIGGRLSMMFDIISTARPFITTDKVRAIAVTSKDRNPTLPDVPTMREAGLPGYEVVGWYGVFGPAGLPAPLIERLNAAAHQALADEALKSLWVSQGYVLWTGSPQTLAEQSRRDLAMWGDVTKGMTFQ